MEPFDLAALIADRRAAREREGRTERLWRRSRRAEPVKAEAKTPQPGCAAARLRAS